VVGRSESASPVLCWRDLSKSFVSARESVAEESTVSSTLDTNPSSEVAGVERFLSASDSKVTVLSSHCVLGEESVLGSDGNCDCDCN